MCVLLGAAIANLDAEHLSGPENFFFLFTTGNVRVMFFSDNMRDKLQVPMSML